MAILSLVPLLRDRSLLLPLLYPRLPAASSVFNMVFGIAAPPAPRIWVDDGDRPQAVIVRGRRLALYALDRPAARNAIAELPRNLRLQFGATPMRFLDIIRDNWSGPDRGARLWINPCHLYALDPNRLVVNRRHRVTSLRSADAPTVVRFWPYGRDVMYVRERISRLPSAAIRRDGRLVAWGLTHDDGSMGFLHVLEEWRGRGFARSLTTALALRLLRLGLRPFLYVVKDNSASIRLTESMGFTRLGSYGWFGSTPRRRSRR